MCLCRNLGLLKESGQYSTLAPKFSQFFYFVHFRSEIMAKVKTTPKRKPKRRDALQDIRHQQRQTTPCITKASIIR